MFHYQARQTEALMGDCSCPVLLLVSIVKPQFQGFNEIGIEFQEMISSSLNVYGSSYLWFQH